MVFISGPHSPSRRRKGPGEDARPRVSQLAPPRAEGRWMFPKSGARAHPTAPEADALPETKRSRAIFVGRDECRWFPKPFWLLHFAPMRSGTGNLFRSPAFRTGRQKTTASPPSIRSGCRAISTFQYLLRPSNLLREGIGSLVLKFLEHQLHGVDVGVIHS
jgi:hypothetical protein